MSLLSWICTACPLLIRIPGRLPSDLRDLVAQRALHEVVLRHMSPDKNNDQGNTHNHVNYRGILIRVEATWSHRKKWNTLVLKSLTTAPNVHAAILAPSDMWTTSNCGPLASQASLESGTRSKGQQVLHELISWFHSMNGKSWRWDAHNLKKYITLPDKIPPSKGVASSRWSRRQWVTDAGNSTCPVALQGARSDCMSAWQNAHPAAWEGPHTHETATSIRTDHNSANSPLTKNFSSAASTKCALFNNAVTNADDKSFNLLQIQLLESISFSLLPSLTWLALLSFVQKWSKQEGRRKLVVLTVRRIAAQRQHSCQ